ncbi:aldo/keto reductase [Weissella cibaria]|uniref:Aldo/keto reductase n=2 Tax=Weissella cibaria TaxID=137591 RepID=A0A9Q8JJT2_9LACO|nr:aldo/keto reductase [Weissella cibaria]TVV37133.1 aldo/keto reductase [Weissella cibaria]TVV41727.1 aldo/keto reductase [Weissella cibaria]UNW40882.1 aldo/keto reductase [Weissella cibaria]
MEFVTLNNGVKMPMVGFGTDAANAELTYNEVMAAATEAGYRMFDTAAMYGNQDELGAYLVNSGLDRSDYFLTSKVAQLEQGYENTLQAFKRTTAALQTDYLDLYLVHWPKFEPFFETWRALEHLYKEGDVRAIGVSNFEAHHLDRLLTQATVVPAVDQIETHPYFNQHVLHNYLTELGIQHQAWSPLGRGAVLQDETLQGIATRYGVSVAQVILRWHIQHNVAVIPKSGNPARMAQNIDLQFQLTPTDMARIDALQRGERIMGAPDQNYTEDLW